jgi:hypothetical protein
MALHSLPGCFQSVPVFQTGLSGGGLPFLLLFVSPVDAWSYCSGADGRGLLDARGVRRRGDRAELVRARLRARRRRRLGCAVRCLRRLVRTMSCPPHSMYLPPPQSASGSGACVLVLICSQALGTAEHDPQRPNVPPSLTQAVQGTGPVDMSAWGPPSAAYMGTRCNVAEFFSRSSSCSTLRSVRPSL